MAQTTHTEPVERALEPSAVEHDPRVQVGQRLAFALAALLVGLASLVNLFGLEKGILAVAFGWLALRRSGGPPLPTRRWWAWTGLALGLASIALVVAALIVYRDELRDVLQGVPGSR